MMGRKKPDPAPLSDMDEIGAELDRMGDAIVARCPPKTGIVIIVTDPYGDGVHSSNLSPSTAAEVMRSVASQIDPKSSSVRTTNLRHN